MALALGSFVFTGCKKDDPDTDTDAASDNALAEATFTDVQNIANEGMDGGLSMYKGPGNNSILSHCATVTRDTAFSGNPDTLTIDFGATNCTGHDGRTRRGKIIIVHNGTYRDSGSYWIITFDNYYVNDHKVEGSKTVKNNGKNSAGHTTYTITVDGKIILSSGGTITWNSNRSREWIEGESTPNWLDDVYLITGTADGVNAKGNSFNAFITLALRRELSCRWFVSGIVDINPSGKPTRSIDFGNGTCDDIATVTINGKQYTIKLR